MKNPLKIPVSRIPAHGCRVGTEIVLDMVRPVEADRIPLDAAALSGTLTDVSGDVLFHGHIRGVFRQACDRCLEMAERSFETEVYWTFEAKEWRMETADNGAGEDGELAAEAAGIYPFNGAEVDLSRPVWDELVLALPVKFLCREDCKGLCPCCGADWNKISCNCESSQEDIKEDRGLSGLADMFPDLAPDKPEE
jgi:uncharacterized metal-binding protein YceD (DUF177 family)